MSELKAFVARKIDDGTCDPVPCVEAYLKSEADKVIAELEESHKKEVGQLLIEIVKLKEHNENYRFDNKNMLHKIMKQDAEIRHHKYKRCLAMAKWCRLRGRLFGACGLYEKELWALKWHKRWLELAERFKEAKQ